MDKQRVTPDKNMYVYVLVKYLSIHLTELSVINWELLLNFAHWCTAIKLSGRVNA